MDSPGSLSSMKRGYIEIGDAEVCVVVKTREEIRNS
jgi:hypothetical protein